MIYEKKIVEKLNTVEEYGFKNSYCGDLKWSTWSPVTLTTTKKI